MELDWQAIDRWIFGEAWTGSKVRDHVDVLCEQIGPRWASSAAEKEAAEYIRGQFVESGLAGAALEEFELDTWAYDRAEASVGSMPIDLLPYNRCPPCKLEAPLVDAGFGTPHALDAVRDKLKGSIAVMHLALEPFTTPVPANIRLQRLADAGAVAIVAIDSKDGRRVEYHNGGDWREPETAEPPCPAVTTSREHGGLLRRWAGEGKKLRLTVESRFYSAPAHNVVGQIKGSRWPAEKLMLGGHHDTVYGTPGGNDNASGTIAVLETARVLGKLQSELGVAPGMDICFATYSAEEQKFQGASEYVRRHCGDKPRLAINLDELSAGHMKGVVLAFGHLRDFVQAHLDTMSDGLQCHVMSQLDATSDHYPFLRQGIDAAHLWRWRFRGRHADSDYHHEPADSADKLNVRETKEYAGQLARLLLRLSHAAPETWPENEVTREAVQARLGRERETVVRVY
ncbi:MAG: hypothetical protein CME20_04285 [Gemmatimonadetes bacterium]|nr:hypothetical protein [Gemmatimonadota bacterium]